MLDTSLDSPQVPQDTRPLLQLPKQEAPPEQQPNQEPPQPQQQPKRERQQNEEPQKRVMKKHRSDISMGTLSAPKLNDHDQEFETLKATYLSHFDFDGIQCTVTPLLPAVLRGVVTNMPVLFEIKVGQRSKAFQTEFARTPFNAVLVLDVSGSMTGIRLEKCKKAINTIIETLTPHDTISLVVYGSRARTVFVDCVDKHKEMMLKKVAEIGMEGYTNLFGGLELGISTLRQSMAKENEVTLKRNSHRVFLFSDGLVTAGVNNHQVILNHCQKWIGNDISISTFGIGSNYDEKLMNSIAKVSDGDSLYIEKEEDIETSVAKGLRGISRVIAPNATLKIQAQGEATIKDIPGYEQVVPGQISLKALRTNGLIQFVVNLEIRAPGADEFTEHDMEDVLDDNKTLDFELTLDEGNFVDKADQNGFDGSVTVNYTCDETLVAEDKKHVDVVTFLTLQECARLNKEASEHFSENRVVEGMELYSRTIDSYVQVSTNDRYGFSRAMEKQSRQMLTNVGRSGNTPQIQKQSAYHSTTTSYSMFDD